MEWGEKNKMCMQAPVCTCEGLMLNSHPQLFCLPGSTNPQPPKDGGRHVREEDKCIKMSLRGWGSSLNTSYTWRDKENRAVTSTQRLLVWWAGRPATSLSWTPSWIPCDNEPNTIFDFLQPSACCERTGISCLHWETNSAFRNPCGRRTRRQMRMKMDYSGLKKLFTALF